jgi:putative DNA primase/helicase
MSGDDRFVAWRDIRGAAKGRETDLLDALGIPWREGKPHISCPYPDHPDHNPSWRWDQRKACAFCSCDGSHSHSIFDVLMKVEAIDFDRAKIRAAELLDLRDLIREPKSSGATPSKRTPIVPVPEDAPVCTWKHPKHGKPVAMWCYRDAEGRPLGYAARVEFIDKDGKRGKEVLPIAYCQVGERRAWLACGLPPPRPLYNMPELLVTPAAPVIVTEGEKKAAAVPALFPGFLGTTSMGGAQAAKHSDWTPLAGRRVIVWPDNDEPGRRYAEDVARLATASGAASVAIVAVPQHWPEGWDLADAMPEGVPPETLTRLLAEAAPWTPPAPEPRQSSETVDDADAVEITRLAKLPLTAYSRERKATAARLGCPLAILDKAVAAERGNGGTSGQGRPLDLPEPERWPEPVDGADLLDELARTIREYVILSPHQADAVALWTTFSHSLDAFDFSPKLVVCSAEKRSGKTRLVEVLERLTRRPFFVSGISAAALLRVIEQHVPTMLLDEVDAQMKGDREMAEALRGLINSGFGRAGARSVKNAPTPDGGFEPRAFSAWCPMLLAGIGRLPDTVADRSIIIEMIRKRRDEKVKRLRTRDGDDLRDLGRKIARWAADNRNAIEQADDPKIPEQLNDRAADTWSPLLAIADVAGGKWPGRTRAAAVALSGAGTDDNESTRIKLLADIHAAFTAQDKDRMASEDLVKYLGGLDDRPWSEYGRGDKPITQTQVARLLKPLHIKPGSIRLDDGKTPKGYYRAAFEDLFARYLPDLRAATPPQLKESAAFSDFSAATSPDVVAFPNRENPSNSKIVAAVAAGNAGKGNAHDDDADASTPNGAAEPPKPGRFTL